jgi:hypothetical protein
MRRLFVKLGLALALPTDLAIGKEQVLAEPRLAGRWRSDLERTRSGLPLAWDQKRIAAVTSLLGKFE